MLTLSNLSQPWAALRQAKLIPGSALRGYLPPRWVSLHSSFSKPGSSVLYPLPVETRSQEGIWRICSWWDNVDRNLPWAVGDWHTLNVGCVAPSGHLKSVNGSQTLLSGILRFQGWVPKGSVMGAGKLALWEKKALICNFWWVQYCNCSHDGWVQATNVKALNLDLERDSFNQLLWATMRLFLALFRGSVQCGFCIFLYRALIFLEVR